MRQRFRQPKFILILITLLALVCVAIDIPKIPLKFGLGKYQVDTTIGGYQLSLFGGRISRDLQLKKGLDIQGGVQVVLEAGMGDIPEENRVAALESAKNVVERRVNFFGVVEPLVQTSRVGDSYRVLVEIPGLSETDAVVSLIGQTAQLEFQEMVELPVEETGGDSSGEASADDSTPPSAFFAPTDLTGQDLKQAAVTFDPNSGAPQVAIEFSEDGGKKFEVLTERLVGQPLAIFLDGVALSVPTVQEKISGGQAIITGDFDVEEAKRLAIQLNAGALPVPLTILEQRQIGATLGTESVRRSIAAGLIGLVLVGIFMWGNYGRLGLLANVALLIYGVITLALYKLIPITLTLSGLAGFLLSIGMAVDSNILIFERIKEEVRSGKPHEVALELGFGRAWDSIRDANVCTLITAFILFNPFNWGFLNTSGMIRGFALTLGLGIGISLFTGVVVTRNLVRVFYNFRRAPRATYVGEGSVSAVRRSRSDG